MARALTKPTMTERGMNRISFATPDSPRMTWKQAGQDHGGHEVVQAVRLHQRRDHEGDGAGGRGDHRRPAADEGDRDGHGEGGEQPDPRVDAGDDREGDRLRDQGQRDDEPAKDLGLEPARGHQGAAHGLELFRGEGGGRLRRFGWPLLAPFRLEKSRRGGFGVR